MLTLTESLTEGMAERLTRPLLDGWHIAFPFDVLRTQCGVCSAQVKFIRITANDCDVWGMAGIDGALSNAYGIYCPDHQ